MVKRVRLELLKLLSGFNRNRQDDGASMVEYGLLTALIAIGSIGAMATMGGDVSTYYGLITSSIESQESKIAPYKMLPGTSATSFIDGANTKLPAAGKWMNVKNGDVRSWDGWVGTFDLSDAKGFNVPPTDAPYLIELDTYSNSQMSRTLEVEEGKKVVLSLDAINRNHRWVHNGKDGVEVLWNGEVVKTIIPSSKSEWQTETVEFFGGSGDGTNKLTFRAIGPSNRAGTLIGRFNTEIESKNPAL